MSLLPVRAIRHANLLALIHYAGSIQKLADALNKSHSQLSQLRNQVVHSTSGKPRTIGDDLAREIEEKLQLPGGWMDNSHASEAFQLWNMHERGDDNLRPPEEAELVSTFAIPKALKAALSGNVHQSHETIPPIGGGAHQVSQGGFTVPPLKTREEVLSGRNLGELFTYTVTDDATRDTYPRGLQIIFRTTGQPKIGKAVLVAHGDQVHVRIYGQGKSAGEWTANAEAPGYFNFNSEDGAVIKGHYKGQIEPDD
ncbi:hypothetical protein J7U46_09700 [Pelomonas sp. V22]|uniref:hypothetical protein n=1 Tax=Pelomonas sp. V22 TaxID=2822139 RepID=UPI0024A8C81C|nr:hypothetical protein [Pelomonas sp. V22]MDI4633320.1 hypothetical protein [Pelomonas sp. V22]